MICPKCCFEMVVIGRPPKMVCVCLECHKIYIAELTDVKGGDENVLVAAIQEGIFP